MVRSRLGHSRRLAGRSRRSRDSQGRICRRVREGMRPTGDRAESPGQEQVPWSWMMPPPSRHAIAVSWSWLLAVCRWRRPAARPTWERRPRASSDHVRNDPDPNVRYLAYSKLGSTDAYDTEEQKSGGGRHPHREVRAGQRAGGQPGDDLPDAGRAPRPQGARPARQGGEQSEAVIKIEACRALGKVGRPEDATVLAQMMTLDNLEDARIAAIEGLAELKTQGPADLQGAARRHGARGPGHPPRLAQCPPQADAARIWAPIPPTGGASSSR